MVRNNGISWHKLVGCFVDLAKNVWTRIDNITPVAVQVEANLQEQLSNHLHFRQEWAFTVLGRSRFESLHVHVAPEWLFATVAIFAITGFTAFDVKCHNVQMSSNFYASS